MPGLPRRRQVALVVLPEGAQIHVVDRDLGGWQPFLREERLFQGEHAADRGAVVAPGSRVAAPHALDEADGGGRPCRRRAARGAPGGGVGGEHPLELGGGEDVGVAAEAELALLRSRRRAPRRAPAPPRPPRSTALRRGGRGPPRPRRRPPRTCRSGYRFRSPPRSPCRPPSGSSGRWPCASPGRRRTRGPSPPGRPPRRRRSRCTCRGPRRWAAWSPGRASPRRRARPPSPWRRGGVPRSRGARTGRRGSRWACRRP